MVGRSSGPYVRHFATATREAGASANAGRPTASAPAVAATEESHWRRVQCDMKLFSKLNCSVNIERRQVDFRAAVFWRDGQGLRLVLAEQREPRGLIGMCDPQTHWISECTRSV